MNYNYSGIIEQIFGPIKTENKVDANLTAGESAFKIVAFTGITVVLVIAAWSLLKK